jgi:hypothetical protein
MSTVVNPLLGSGASSTTTNPGTKTSGISGALGGALSGGLSSITGPVTTAVTSTVANGLEATIFSSRVIAIVLGLLLIGGAILLYIGEDLSGAISQGSKIAAKVAA